MFSARWPAVLLCGATVLTACGGANFVRDDKVPKYKSLPPKTEVLIVPTAAELPAPTADLGQLWAPSSNGEADRKGIEADFKAVAWRAGCDVVADMAVQDTPLTSTRTVKTKGANGKIDSRQEEVTTHTFKWTARCIRTAKAGLQGAPAATEAPGGAAPEAPGGAVAPPGVPEPLAADTPAAVRDLVTRLEPLHENYLRGWKDKLRAARPDPADVLDAFSELMVQVTGPTGFWRKTVPQAWLGCGSDPSTDSCQRLAATTPELKKWDALQAAIGGLGKGQASGWLKGHQKQLVEYLDTYVPLEPSMSGAQATAFYQARLQ